MDPQAFDRISRAIGGRSRRHAVAAAGAALGASLLGRGAGHVSAGDAKVARVAARARLALGADLANAQGGQPEAGKSKSKGKKCKPCANCSCAAAGGYIEGTADTLCVMFYDGSLQAACEDAGLQCAAIAGNCGNARPCIDKFFNDWFGV